MTGDYLWDGRGEPDELTRELECELSRERWVPRELPELAPPRRAEPARTRRLVLVAAAVAASVALIAILGRGPESPYRLELVSGSPIVTGVAETGTRLELGSAIECRDGDRAIVHVGDIGRVELAPGSRLSLKRAGELPATEDAGYLVDLERGTLTASIFAAPRLFQLGTPAGLAVDLGCIYEARVAEDGATDLEVVHGHVSFETPTRRVLVPSGSSVRAYPGRGPGTPVWNDAPDALREAARTLDELGSDADALVERIFVHMREADTLTLWHLLDAPGISQAGRERVTTRLEELVPRPGGVTREGVLAGDERMRELWRRRFSWGL